METWNREFAEFYKRTFPEAVKSLKRLGFGDESEDVAQDIFLAICQVRPAPSGFESYYQQAFQDRTTNASVKAKRSRDALSRRGKLVSFDDDRQYTGNYWDDLTSGERAKVRQGVEYDGNEEQL